MAAKWQKEWWQLLCTENSDILCAEWLDENDVDLSGLSVQQNDGNDESDNTRIITIKELLIFQWKMIEADIKKFDNNIQFNNYFIYFQNIIVTNSKL